MYLSLNIIIKVIVSVVWWFVLSVSIRFILIINDLLKKLCTVEKGIYTVLSQNG